MPMRSVGSMILAAPFAAATALGQDVKPMTEAWQPLDPGFGLGVATCFTDDEIGNYWCFAIRCQDGGAFEFVHLFAGGDPVPEGVLVVDGKEFGLTFNVISEYEEHAAPLHPDTLVLDALKAGEWAEYVSAEALHFPIDLTGAAEGISSVEAECR